MKIVPLGLSFIFLFKSPNLEFCSSSYNQITNYCSRGQILQILGFPEFTQFASNIRAFYAQN